MVEVIPHWHPIFVHLAIALFYLSAQGIIALFATAVLNGAVINTKKGIDGNLHVDELKWVLYA